MEFLPDSGTLPLGIRRDHEQTITPEHGVHQSGIAERKAAIDRGHDLPIARQPEGLRIGRGSVYDQPRPVPEADLAIMRRLDWLKASLRDNPLSL